MHKRRTQNSCPPKKGYVIETLRRRPLISTHPTSKAVVETCCDQNAIHQIRPDSIGTWVNLVNVLTENDYCLQTVCSDRNGCRTVQHILENLITIQNCDLEISPVAGQLFHDLVEHVIGIGNIFSSHVSANYVIQCILSVSIEYGEEVIRKHLLLKLFSLAQEKFGSHVLEKAFKKASPRVVLAMLEELLDGYLPHHRTKKEAIELLMTHQFGNYVFQRVLETCVDPFTINPNWLSYPLKREERDYLQAKKKFLIKIINKNTQILERTTCGSTILTYVANAKKRGLI